MPLDKAEEARKNVLQHTRSVVVVARSRTARNTHTVSAAATVLLVQLVRMDERDDGEEERCVARSSARASPLRLCQFSVCRTGACSGI